MLASYIWSLSTIAQQIRLVSCFAGRFGFHCSMHFPENKLTVALIAATADMRRSVHTVLLGAGILIVEHMCNLEQLPDGQRFKFFAVPVKVKGFGTFPVRA